MPVQMPQRALVSCRRSVFIHAKENELSQNKFDQPRRLPLSEIRDAKDIYNAEMGDAIDFQRIAMQEVTLEWRAVFSSSLF